MFSANLSIHLCAVNCANFKNGEAKTHKVSQLPIILVAFIKPLHTSWTAGPETYHTMTGTILPEGHGLLGWARLCGTPHRTHCCWRMGW